MGRERRRGLAALSALAAALAGCASAGPPRQHDQYARDPWLHRDLSRYDDGWEEWGAFHLLERNFDDGELSEGDGQFGLGLELVGRPYDAFLAFEFGLWSSSSEARWTRWTPVFQEIDELDLESGESGSRAFEISLGLRKEVRPFDGPVVLHAGVGGAMQQLEESVLVGSFQEDSDADLGLYAHWGAYLALGGNGGLGVGGRFLEGTEYELLGRRVSGDYVQWSLTLSFWF